MERSSNFADSAAKLGKNGGADYGARGKRKDS